jgi:hypothetical protein
MASALEIDAGTPAVARTRLPRALREHAFLSVVVACLLVGGGLRLVPNSTAASSGSGSPASTACAAK